MYYGLLSIICSTIPQIKHGTSLWNGWLFATHWCSRYLSCYFMDLYYQYLYPSILLGWIFLSKLCFFAYNNQNPLFFFKVFTCFILNTLAILFPFVCTMFSNCIKSMLPWGSQRNHHLLVWGSLDRVWSSFKEVA